MANETEVTKTDDSLTLVRMFDAPVERVFAAWTTPALVDRWWGCAEAESVQSTIEPRVGGAFRTVMQIRNHGEHASDGTITVFEPNARLAIRSQHEGTELCVDVTFEPVADRTRVTVRQIGFPFPGAGEMIEAGYRASFEKLAKTL